jgi:hypothetical protein
VQNADRKQKKREAEEERENAKREGRKEKKRAGVIRLQQVPSGESQGSSMGGIE